MIPIAARRKVLHAASNVTTSSCREAAVLGGIVRCAIEYGRYDQRVIAAWTRDALRGMAGVNTSPPNRAEISGVLERFQACYGRPFTP